MKRVDEDLLEFALKALSAWYESVSAQSARHIYSLLPIKLALAEMVSAPYLERDDESFLNSYFRIAGASSEQPFFDPFSLKWLPDGYAHSNIATFRKRTFVRSWGAATWEGDVVSLSANWAPIFVERALTKAGSTKRIPAIPLAIWFLKSDSPLAAKLDGGSLPAKSEDLAGALRDWLGMSEADWPQIFQASTEDEETYERLVEAASSTGLSNDEILHVCQLLERDSTAGGTTIALRQSDETPNPLDVQLLAERLFVQDSDIDDMLWILERKGALLLSGPPGVGKTFVARSLATFIGDGNYTFVQFHPSYTYESFISGFRAESGAEGSMVFRVTSGPLLDSVRAAASAYAESADEASRHVLVIDEINRANVSAVFGEFLTAMEYRDSDVLLQYADDISESIRVPPNFFLIATMNRADRSAGNFDAAIRRRFGTYACSPVSGAFRGVLGRYVGSRYPDGSNAWIPSWIDELNALIPDPDFCIGASYFFGADLGDDKEIQRIIQYEIRPYLVEKFGLAALSAAEGLLDPTSIISRRP